jgi:hypothetical protein
VTGAAWDLDGLAGLGGQLGDDGLAHELAASVPPGGGEGFAVADEMRPHHLARIVIDGPRPEQPGRDGVEGDGDIAPLCLVALDDLHQLDLGAVARKVLPGHFVLGHGGAGDRQHADERDEVALGEKLIVRHRRRQRHDRRGHEGDDEKQAERGEDALHGRPAQARWADILWQQAGRRQPNLW